MSVCKCVYIYIYTHIHVCIYTYAYIYLYITVDMCVSKPYECIHVYIYIQYISCKKLTVSRWCIPSLFSAADMFQASHGGVFAGRLQKIIDQPYIYIYRYIYIYISNFGPYVLEMMEMDQFRGFIANCTGDFSVNTFFAFWTRPPSMMSYPSI